MTTYVMRNGKLVDRAIAPPLASHSAAPHVISDIMPTLINHADGRRYDSKAKFRQATKAMGCIELGTEKLPERRPVKLDRAQRRDDIRRSIHQLRNGFRPQYSNNEG